MSTASPFEQEMLALINEERTSRGLNPLKLESQLNDAAEDHSAWMLNTDTFSHTGAGGSTSTERMKDAGFDFSGNWRSGENIAWQSERGAEGINDDVEQLHQNLMNSPSHRANILNPDYEYIGIGIEEGDYNGWDAVMVTQNFATTDAEVMLDTGPTPTPPAVDTSQEVEAKEPQIQTVDAPEIEDSIEDTPNPDFAEPEAPEPAVIETKQPVEKTPSNVTAVSEDEETQEDDIPDSAADDFNVDAFLAGIEGFISDLLIVVEDSHQIETTMTDADSKEDDFLLTWDFGDGFRAAPEDLVDAPAEAPDVCSTLMQLDFGFLMDFA